MGILGLNLPKHIILCDVLKICFVLIRAIRTKLRYLGISKNYLPEFILMITNQKLYH
jgi:hypothetical protein